MSDGAGGFSGVDPNEVEGDSLVGATLQTRPRRSLGSMSDFVTRRESQAYTDGLRNDMLLMLKDLNVAVQAIGKSFSHVTDEMSDFDAALVSLSVMSQRMQAQMDALKAEQEARTLRGRWRRVCAWCVGALTELGLHSPYAEMQVNTEPLEASALAETYGPDAITAFCDALNEQAIRNAQRTVSNAAH